MEIVCNDRWYAQQLLTMNEILRYDVLDWRQLARRIFVSMA